MIEGGVPNLICGKVDYPQRFRAAAREKGGNNQTEKDSASYHHLVWIKRWVTTSDHTVPQSKTVLAKGADLL
ncbi:hypothetical protein CLOSTMETH_01094 [[Clostridium] methylpentosum DSM 5476]|uniref:Uncharacterized protein n=1 Tax=[Clostridium] methylpentosum DSM 5476 TaxID=537013 RepID=C0EB77_9FIRM|nr:hypothetical protein CLOSTMETH_01094 [[Clostridium] methylpentosum DSM 5476]